MSCHDGDVIKPKERHPPARDLWSDGVEVLSRRRADAESDQWRAATPEQGLMLYAVVADRTTVIVLRLIVL